MKAAMLCMVFMVYVATQVVCHDDKDIIINIGSAVDGSWAISKHTKNVGFSVGSMKGVNSANPIRIPYEVILYNDGQYFQADNAFHAPVNGVYSFSFGALSVNGKLLDMHLCTQKPGKGQVCVARAYQSGPGYNSASASALVKLDKGDIAFVIAVSGAYIWASSPPSTLFSGELRRLL